MTQRRSYRPWTARERNLMRQHYGPNSPRQLPTRQLAELIGRTVDNIREAAKRFACDVSKRWWGADDDGRLRELHALGWSDQRIADELGFRNGVTVREHRLALGLPSNRWSDAQRKQHRQRYKIPLWRDYGCRTLVDLRRQRRRVAACFAGWPGAAGPEEVRVLESLRDDGPQDAHQLADRLGYRTSWMVSRHLKRLFADGLVRVAEKRGNALVFELVERREVVDD